MMVAGTSGQMTVCGALSALLLLCLLLGVTTAIRVEKRQQGRWAKSRRRRAGDVTGLEDGRLSLAKVSAMLTSSVHVEVRLPLSAVFSHHALFPLATPRDLGRLSHGPTAQPAGHLSRGSA